MERARRLPGGPLGELRELTVVALGLPPEAVRLLEDFLGGRVRVMTAMSKLEELKKAAEVSVVISR